MHARFPTWAMACALLSLAACSAVYSRGFTVVPEQALSMAQRRQLVYDYGEFMRDHGYVTETTDTDVALAVTFRIRDARMGPLPTSRASDTILAHVDEQGTISLSLQRFTSLPPDDFKDAYLAEFAALTTRFIRESSGRSVVVQLLPR